VSQGRASFAFREGEAAAAVHPTWRVHRDALRRFALGVETDAEAEAAVAPDHARAAA
jgi:hypothetical protein